MKFTERFWTETIPRLSVAAEAALLHVLLRRSADLPPGVFNASAATFEELGRFAWAPSQIEAELAFAPGVVVDTRTKLAVVWEVALSDLPRAPMPARGHGRRIGLTAASWTPELYERTRQALDGTVRAAFVAGFAEKAKAGRPHAMKARPRVADIDPDVAMLKGLEHELRASFDGVTDGGKKASAADRLAIVKLLAHGVSVEDIAMALRGRAEKCARSRMWQDIDTAEHFLWLSWVCSTRSRFDDAVRSAPMSQASDVGLVRTQAGTFVGGRQLFE